MQSRTYQKGDLILTAESHSYEDGCEGTGSPCPCRPLRLMLPHQCDYWVIGGRAEALVLIGDIQQMLARIDGEGA